MVIIVGLLLLMMIALLVVGGINRLQQQERLRRLQQRHIRLQAEELSEVVFCLEQTVPNRLIAKLFNDVVITLLQNILRLETKNTEHIETAIQKAEAHSNMLANPKEALPTSYQKESDAQIAKAQLHLMEAINLLPQLTAQGRISEVEMEVYLTELRWAHLMVAVMSYIGQGDKSMAISDRFSAQAFYRKAQHLLMESLQQDPRRLRLIKELSEMIDGSRPSLSRDLRDSGLARY